MKNARMASLIFCFVFLFSCGKAKQTNTDIVITFWHSFVTSTIPALNDLIARFELENPGIKVKPQYIPTGDALIQKLITSVQSKTAPDISWIHADYMQNLVEAGAIYPMAEFIDGGNGLSKEDMQDIYPPLIQYASWRGILYSMPMEATNLALLYNKKMFREAGLDTTRPPQDWDELFRYAKKLTIDKDGDGIFDQVGFSLPVFPATGPNGPWMVWQWFPYVWQAGGDIIDMNQTRVLYNEEPGIKALQLWQNIYEDLKLNSFTTDYDIAFASERLAMSMDGPWNLPRYQTFLKKLKWAIGPLPAGPARHATILGGEYLAIFKQSKNPQQAWQFIKWITCPEIQAMWAMKSGYLPIRHAALKIPEFQAYLKTHANFDAFVQQMEDGQILRPVDYHGLEISRHIAEAIEKATIGKMDVKTVLDEAAKKSNELLALHR
jgi:multiple sugar transport system substrate-binding protein